MSNLYTIPKHVLELQPSSAGIMADKRLMPGENLDGMRRRLAKALSRPEAKPGDWEEAFYWALHFAFPGGRISANAGAESWKPNVSTINCTVSGTIPDSMDGILSAAHKAGITLKYGCGIGYDFSTIRPDGAFVSGAGASTSGPLPFMDIFDAVCKTVKSAGDRRGAQMGCLDIGHPDVEAFIAAKREPGRFRNFNLSLLVNKQFIEQVKEGGDWPLAFPANERELKEGCHEIIWQYWPLSYEKYTYNTIGQVACRVYRRVKAVDLWLTIMRSTYEHWDPGFLVIDQINDLNPLWFCENIRATNPCGEQPLPPNGACLLGSVNLVSMVANPFTSQAYFDWDLYGRVVRIFSRMLDNVVEINGLPLQEQRDEILSKRRHGMGYLGLGSTMTMMGMKYGDAESVDFTGEVTKQLAIHSWRAALELSKEKGPAPILNQKFTVTAEMLARDSYLATTLNLREGDEVYGRQLHAASRYMRRIGEVDPETVRQLGEVGARYTHATSLAPTGTMAAGEGNNASNGIEPSFMHAYNRNIIVPGKATKEQVTMLSYEMLAYQKFVDPNVDPFNPPSFFDGTTAEVDPKKHVDVQAAAQYWVDSAISKTINCPAEISFEDFKGIYLYAIDKGLKGCTTYRPKPERAGVLVSNEQLANTYYQFTLEDGGKVTLRGDEKVEYRGNVSTAANLHDALSEGYFGKL